MDSKFKPESINNVFRELNKENSRYLMGLSLASNDLVMNINTFKHYPPIESNYFFSNAISILRETALLILKINESTLTKKYSSTTKSIFDKLKKELIPFHDGSLTKATLKPIRDFTFHYNLNNLKEKEVIESTFETLKKSNTIEIGFELNNETAMGQRYLFADSFRNDYINNYLSKDIVSIMSAISVDLISFIDSLMRDINIKIDNESAL